MTCFTATLSLRPFTAENSRTVAATASLWSMPYRLGIAFIIEITQGESANTIQVYPSLARVSTRFNTSWVIAMMHPGAIPFQ
ncbi:hypothetical protein Y032_0721g1825 [Ancylostoma ceylanicum]|uniref:Uncharacterized protein n=1 Tax=Ancylostoma ceylanicum TaxID=53326 RepID=A0A016WFI5_9BILA|nr:hypothetical protein Y032_0721g1825 [Ancylostoma ceylanicum]